MTQTRDYGALLLENRARRAEFERRYDPLTGEGSTALPRVRCEIGDYYGEGRRGVLWLPTVMVEEEGGVQDLLRAGSFRAFVAERDGIRRDQVSDQSIDTEFIDFCRIRTEYDFEYWAAACATIKDKESGQDTGFRLNYAQRAILLPAFEKQRLAEQPIRVILVKARQWGGSTLTQLYMLWIQVVHKTGWNSVIAAHKKSGSRTIKGMLTKTIKNYPEQMGRYDIRRWENSGSTSIIEGRNCKVTIGTAQVPDSVRSEDIVMAHLSEVAYWQNADTIKPEDLIASIVGSILRVPLSLVVMESTANGVGNFFHKEWLAATDEDPQNKSDKVPVFVPWWKIELYRTAPIKTEAALRRSMEAWGEYQWELWAMGATAEAVDWWEMKRRELRTAGIAKMKSEYPSTAEEAFVSTGEGVFGVMQCRRMGASCCEPKLRGALTADGSDGKKCRKNLRFVSDEAGRLDVWELPDRELQIANRYLVVVDVGGRSARSDWSVICVIDRSARMGGGVDAVVAQWRGHIDHDLLVWKAVQIATWYCNALLVIEANTLETEATDGDHTQFILEKVADCYTNLYAREDPDKVRMGVPLRYGFHTNRATKTAVIDNEVLMYRTQGYVERCRGAVDEHATYERAQNGSFAAKQGCHDDMLMTRAIGMYISENMAPPRIVKPRSLRGKIMGALGMSSF